jgi:integrase
MQYLDKKELIRLFTVARDSNPQHHLAMLVGFLHGLRVSETLAIRGRDIADGKLAVRRLKKSRSTLHDLLIDADPLFDESPLIELAESTSGELFPWSRQYMDRMIKQYARVAGIHPDKAHYHVLKHSVCVLLWKETHDLNAIQDHVGHRAASSSLVYLRSDAARKAQTVINSVSFAA